MPKIQLTQPHSLSTPDVRKHIDRLNQELGAKYDIKSTWVSDTEAKIERSGVTGSIRIEPKQISVNLDLSLVLTPVKGTIESRIREELKKITA